MATKNERTEIAVLQTQMASVQTDVNSIKNDIKEIKNTLSGSFVTQAQFAEYKKNQSWQKASIGLAMLFIGSLVTYFFSNVGGKS